MSWTEALFGGAALIPAYSYAGYPILLALVARVRPAPPVKRGEAVPTVSVVIVAHNEEATIETKLRNCLELDYPAERREILVASDGSRDLTEEIVSRFSGQGVHLLALPGPNGKPSALNQAIPATSGEILVLCDARQRLDRQAIRALVAPFADPTVGAVSGELHLEAALGSSGEGVAAYWRYEKLVRALESRVGSVVGVTGAIYALRRECFRPLDPRTILDDVAIPMAVAASGLRVLFEPTAQAFDRTPEDAHKEYRRKVRTLAGNYQLVFLWPWLLNPLRNPLFWQFLSHKLSRLLVPWCLLGLLATSAVLSVRPGFYRLALLAQLAFYLLAAGGWLLERLAVRLRVFSVPYAFLMLNVAAASSLFGFLQGTQRASWKRASS